MIAAQGTIIIIKGSGPFNPCGGGRVSKRFPARYITDRLNSWLSIYLFISRGGEGKNTGLHKIIYKTNDAYNYTQNKVHTEICEYS